MSTMDDKRNSIDKPATLTQSGQVIVAHSFKLSQTVKRNIRAALQRRAVKRAR